MDDYQKHLERQLQQQQLRSQATDLNVPRPPLQQPLLQQPRIQPPTAQWNSNMMTGAPPQGIAPAVPGFSRGLNINPMGLNAAPQPPQQNMQVQQATFTPSPQTHVHSLHNPVQPPTQKARTSPAPGSPVGADSQNEKFRIATILEINSHLIKLCVSMQSAVATPNVTTDPTYVGCLQRLQQNLAYLAAIADRANKPEAGPRALPQLSLLSSPPMIRILEEKQALDRLYAALSTLQSTAESSIGENVSGSEPGSQINSPQVRSRQTSAGSQGPHAPTPPTQRSQLPGHTAQHSPSPHLVPSQLHGQSGLNPNANQANVRPQQTQQQQFQQNFNQTQQFQPQNQSLQYQQIAQHLQTQPQTQNQSFIPQNMLQQQTVSRPFQPQNQNQPFQDAQTQPFQQSQTQQFQQTQNDQFQQSQQSFQPQSHLQTRVPSRPPSRPSSQHSLGQSHQPSPTVSPRPPHQRGPSPQLSNTPTPPNPNARVGVPNPPVELTPEQTAVLQERVRLARMQQLQQSQNVNRSNHMNLFALQNGVNLQNQTNGFNTFNGNSSMMNGMSPTSSPAQNQNFGGGQ